MVNIQRVYKDKEKPEHINGLQLPVQFSAENIVLQG